MNPYISIIIPVYNERDRINHLLSYLNKLHLKDGFEVIVVDGSKEKNTIRFIEPSLYANFTLKTVSSQKGRGIQMNKGAIYAGGVVLLFLHCDTVITQNGLNLIQSAFNGKNIAGGAFDLAISSDKKKFKIIEKMASIRSRLTEIPYGDQSIFIKKSIFTKLGGYSKIPIMEDVDLMRRIKKSGAKIKIFREKVYTSPRRWEKEGALYATLRNWMLIILYTTGVSPEKLAKFYK